MYTKGFTLMALAMSLSLFSCSNDDPEPTPNPDNNGGGDENTETSLYPEGSIVWKEDTTVILKDHFLVDKDKSLYIEQGAKIIADNADKKPEIVVLGNMYCMGTAEKPVTFTVADTYKTDRFSRMWGGIICGYDSKEVLLSHAIVEYCGAQTTEESLSFQYKLFKTETGEGVPAFHFCNVDGQFVIKDCVFRNNAEDQIYITGGKSIVANNLFYSNGFDGGEAINYKSGCQADICYNVIYDANTNGFKLSNAGLSANIPASHLVIYNNTIVNSGWRRPSKKGGSIWLEANIYADLYNNLIADCRWGMKHSTSESEDAKSGLTPNYYFASTEAGVKQMTANEEDGILGFDTDIKSASAGDKDPMFVNFKQQSDININVGGNAEGAPAEYNEAWDFHLQAGSPALKGGKTDFERLYATTAIEFNGLKTDNASSQFFPVSASYMTLPPSEFFGAYGVK